MAGGLSMTEQTEIMRMRISSPADLVRSLFKSKERAVPSLDPRHSDVPELLGAEFAAVYYNLRVAGDFYEFLRVGPSRVLFAMLDLAGRRGDTREILVAAQDAFRSGAPPLFAGDDFNEAEAVIELSHEINRTILQFAGGVRSCPAFIGCYNEDLGTVCYTNAGHPPGLLRDRTGITMLESTGLPLGLFSHATHGASTCALLPGAALLIVSRGIVEAEFGGEEFGVEGVRDTVQNATFRTARDLCLTILQRAQQFMRVPPTYNDVTTLALVRKV
jgi:sigma-B regulation protein RsbU (phosphoserine phosphatase)